MKPALKFPAKIKHGDSISSGSNFIPGVSPETPALLLAKRRGRIPFQEQEKFALFGPALTSVATTRPSGAPLKRPGLHSPNSEDPLTACTPKNTTRDSLDFPKIRATRASNTAKVTIADLFLVV
ncbi:unnamed protein product [Pleuronectes platessa]|uniref:Uncharacterized protein n=1 Tax=Pleuronectes platessa TaxID=8262 RepID=A0A9N7UME8_PLEPL|nr:unnamed protein product [Pleuronectes platessa]